MFMYLNVLLLIFFCYLYLLSGRVDEILDLICVVDLRYIFDFVEIVVLGMFGKIINC